MLDHTLEKLVNYMAEKKASDLFITVGLPPCLKVNGTVMPITKNNPPMTVLRKLKTRCAIVQKNVTNTMIATVYR